MPILDPQWLAGFTDAEGCFLVSIFKSNNKIGSTVKLRFTLTQHSNPPRLFVIWNVAGGVVILNYWKVSLVIYFLSRQIPVLNERQAAEG
jgi:sorbitol-specific phosphotransferase system component IIC